MDRGLTLLSKTLSVLVGMVLLVFLFFSFMAGSHIQKNIDDSQIKAASYFSSKEFQPPFQTEDVQVSDFEFNTIIKNKDSFLSRAFEKIQSGNNHIYYEWDSAQNLKYACVVDIQGIKNIRTIYIDSDVSRAHRVVGNSLISLGVVVSVIVLLIGFWFFLEKIVFRYIKDLQEVTGRSLRGDRSARCSFKTGDELERLGSSINTLLDQIEEDEKDFNRIKDGLNLKVAELAKANTDLFQSTKLKSEFLANVSHELRTPMNSIIGFAELLEEGANLERAGDPKYQRYVANILMSARSLRDMISELLDMAKIEAGRFEVEIKQCCVVDLLVGLVEIMRPQAESKNLQMNFLNQIDLPDIETDPGKLQQILHNILANAIKFTPIGGSVSIGAAPRLISETVSGIRISIRDSGPGIPADMLDSIFEKFRQVDSGHTRNYEGTGLGLAICKELSSMIQGKVSVESVQGRGSTFHIDVPIFWESPPEPTLMG